ncbi:MAG: hypothetical protein RBR50_09805 [Candidatus Izemoplasmatales bacterium]|jgi:hypothetical protein|nr:hypothetical protein [Candidatus Izemoplasmatales bacterium]
MDKYLQNWLDILQGMANDNTYKLAWGRSIVEIIYMNEYVNHGDKIEIPFSLISHHMLKYYWNQTFFFNLKQSPNQKKPPRVYQIVSNLIDQYKQIENTNIPIWFNRLETFFVKNSILYEKTILNISKILKIDVCWRFLKANGIEYDIYTLDEKKKR